MRKSADQKRYEANYGLTWLLGNNRAHGDFTLDAGQRDTIDMTLMDVTSTTAWDGKSLTKKGGGALVLTGDHVYTGVTTIESGTLQLGAGGNAGSVRGDILNNGALIFDRGDDGVTYRGAISGSGTVSKAKAASLILAGDNTYTGQTTVAGGRLQVGAGGTGGSLTSNVVFNCSGELIFDRRDTSRYENAVSGPARLTKRGAGLLVLTGDHVYTGGTVIEAGSLQLGDGGVNGSVQGRIVNNGTLIINRSGSMTYADDAISSTGSLVKQGGNVLTLSGQNTYSGATSVMAGTLRAGAANAFVQTSGVSVASGATLNLGGFSQVIADLSNSGLVLFGDLGVPMRVTDITVTGNMRNNGMLVLNTCSNCTGQTATWTGDWIGEGGSVSFGTVLGGDDSKTDKLVITGNATGTTYVIVANEGGSGAQTVEGIELIRTASSTDSAFVQKGRISAGAFDYRLKKASASGNNENWLS